MAGLMRRGLLLGAGAALGWAGARALGPNLPVLDGTAAVGPSDAQGVLNDASLLSETPVHSHITLGQDPGEALVAALRGELKAAASESRAVNIGAARHSMGGQAIPRNGHAVSFDNGLIEPDTAAGTYRCHAGARWSQVIAALDPIGFGPKVMQSNHDFGVAATYCVNAHGWPVPFGPMGHTVRAVEMVLPSGDLVRASREENAELFTHAMGGYGLTGLIIAMEVEMVENQLVEPSFAEMPAEAFAPAFQAALDDPGVTMAYGRLNVARAAFFDEALLITYRPAADQSEIPPATGSGWMSHIARHVYRAQLGNERLKGVRWWTETDVGPALGGGAANRNSLMNEPVATLDDRDPTRTDILHEYFVGFDRFPDFLEVCRRVIPASYQEFLNVTLRYVAQDDEAWLSYAPVPRIAAVMSFSQEMTARGEADMARMTEALIEGIIGIGGSYYLPYRPHATQAQFTRCYKRAGEFVAQKREIDPGLLLRNGLWDGYMAAL
ncbi:FAD binding domain protein [Candidatus Rhodobacter oscarellae]|uniref:FAD binding domain protein n=1 Tax=Candidatus Rhodobacter oscarellae TaxID=1675527 RepID=A0A0J9E7E0_9RHOB|nr:FAD-binding protein [Candidatus Rhodobacter lobularis]KMW58612.1 FAD binding domain protein [Candidatus Rhodobacter lobularis]